MLTIFSIPKPFTGHIGIIQRNAIASWRRLDPSCEIILFGNDAGVKEAAEEFGVTHVPDVECTDFGTPLLSSVFARVNHIARNPLLCYVNGDIMLLGDFLETIRRIPFERFLAVGQRWDLDVTEALDISSRDAETNLRRRLDADGSLHAITGIDYFVFSRDSGLSEMPPFAVGRPGWDNWFIYNARRLRLPVVDITPATRVIHQNHDYRHVPNQQGKSYEGPEADKNRTIMGGWEYVFSLHDATHILTPTALRRATGPEYRRRRLETLPTLHPVIWRCLLPARLVRRAWVGVFGKTGKK